MCLKPLKINIWDFFDYKTHNRYQLNTSPIKYIEANKVYRQFKVMGNQINRNISIIRVYLTLNHLDGNAFKVFDSVGHSQMTSMSNLRFGQLL